MQFMGSSNSRSVLFGLKCWLPSTLLLFSSSRSQQLTGRTKAQFHVCVDSGVIRMACVSRKGFSCIPFSHGWRGWLATPNLTLLRPLRQRSVRSLSKQPSCNFLRLGFIFRVCGLEKKKLIRGGSCHRGIQIVRVWPRLCWPSMRTLFSLITFELILHLWTAFVSHNLLDFNLAYCLVLWSLSHSTTTKTKRLILFIALAGIRLWSEFVVKNSVPVEEEETFCAWDLASVEMRGTSLESCCFWAIFRHVSCLTF